MWKHWDGKSMHYNQEDEAELRELLFGRKVTKVADNKLQLDNGLVLTIEPNEGCGGCSSGWYELTELNECDNAITNVELVTEDVDGDETKFSYKIFVLAEDRRILLAQVDGDDGNGYYGTGYEIIIRNIESGVNNG